MSGRRGFTREQFLAATREPIIAAALPVEDEAHVPPAVAMEMSESNCCVVVGKNPSGKYAWEIWKREGTRRVTKYIGGGPYDDLESAKEDGEKIYQWIRINYGPNGDGRVMYLTQLAERN